jgi:hypothetical protein
VRLLFKINKSKENLQKSYEIKIKFYDFIIFSFPKYRPKMRPKQYFGFAG